MTYSEYEFFGFSTAPEEVTPQARSLHATCRHEACLRAITPGCGAQCRECYEREQSRRMRVAADPKGMMHF